MERILCYSSHILLCSVSLHMCIVLEGYDTNNGVSRGRYK